MQEIIQFKLNGEPVSVTSQADRKLLWVLRTDLGLTGSKFGCGKGFCGSCTVLVNDEPVRSCQTAMKELHGKEVVTIEGLERNGSLHPIQKAFMDHDALQCGYCTSGMVMQAYSLLKKNPSPSQAQILDGMENNLCRCGAHNRIVRAVQEAATVIRGGAL